MLLIGVIWGALHGNLSAVTDGALTSSAKGIGDAVHYHAWNYVFWTGLMEIGSKSGLIERLSAKMGPVLHFLFPKIPEKHPSLEYILLISLQTFWVGGQHACWSEGNGIV